ncbi:MAG TPA: tetratricopeptide repeat protein [Planctomycetota bacterium]|nr:tetratricopeptide repeat protein [Planctomycetota bacterium]
MLDRAIRIAPRNHSFHYDRACVRLRLGRSRAAIEDFTRIARNRGFCMLAAEGRGRARALRGDLRSALKDLDRAVRMRAGIRENHFYRGLVRFLSKDLVGAARDFSAGNVPRGLAAGMTQQRAKELLRRDLPY